MSPSTPQQPLPQLPANIPPPPTFGASPQGQKPKAKSTTPTFLGTGSLPSPGNLGGKALIGQ